MVGVARSRTIFRELQQAALEEGIYKHLARGIIEANGSLLMLRRSESNNPEKNRTLEHAGGKAEISYMVQGIHIGQIIFPGSTPQHRERIFPATDVIRLILDKHIESIDTTLRREIPEETGNRVSSIGPLVHVEDFTDKNGVLSREFTFEVAIVQPMKAIRLTEHDSYLWVPRHVGRAHRATEAHWAARIGKP